MTDRELMQMALDALEAALSNDQPYISRSEETAEALRARLAQPEQEIDPDRPHVEDDGCPTEKAVLQRFWREHQAQPERKLWLWKKEFEEAMRCGYAIFKPSRDGSRGRTEEQVLREMESVSARSEREWQGLTDEEYEAMAEKYVTNYFFDTLKYAKAIEDKLKEKNT